MLFRSQKTTAGQAPEYLVVGLGNPGSQYECTRHNAGFIAMDIMAEKLGFDIKRLKFKGLIGDTVIDGHRVAFLKPSTFMNLSGESVRDAMQFYKIPVEKLLVICDDISLAPGRLRIRRKGSAGGHNGLKNIIYLLGRDDFARVKLGVGEKPHPDYDLADWVLGRFTKEQGEALEITGIDDGLKNGTFTLKAGDKTIVLTGSFTQRQADILKAGGLLNYTAQKQ